MINGFGHLSSSKARAAGRAAAVRHYMSVTGADEEEAQAFYESIRTFCSSAKTVINMPLHGVVSLFGAAFLAQDDSERRRQALRALGMKDAVFAEVSKGHGERAPRDCTVFLDGLKDVFLVRGGVDRLRDPARFDFEPQPLDACYAMADMADCRAASTVMALRKHELMGGPLQAFASAVADGREYGRCDAVICERVLPAHVVKVSAPDDEVAARIREYLDSIGKAAAVDVFCTDTETFRLVDPAAVVADGMDKVRAPTRQLHFIVGDRVATKRTMSNPNVFGTITDISDCTLTVQWDGGERTVFDMAEALMRIMQAPEQRHPIFGGVIYTMPGMDSATVDTLTRVGIDPVSVYSVASHAKPASARAEGWREHMEEGLSVLGVGGSFVSGWAESLHETDDAFEPRQWFEGKLPNGARLVIDIGEDRFIITAGEADGYVIPRQEPAVEE